MLGYLLGFHVKLAHYLTSNVLAKALRMHWLAVSLGMLMGHSTVHIPQPTYKLVCFFKKKQFKISFLLIFIPPPP